MNARRNAAADERTQSRRRGVHLFYRIEKQMRTKMRTQRILLPKHTKARLMDLEKIIGLCLASIVCAAACTAVIMHAVQKEREARMRDTAMAWIVSAAAMVCFLVALKR